MKKLFRFHRGGLAESLATTIEVKDLQDMGNRIKSKIPHTRNIRIIKVAHSDVRLPKEWGNVSYLVLADEKNGISGCVGMCNFYEE